MKKIIFTNTINFEMLPKPQKASAFIPNWYKKLESYIGGVKQPNGKGSTTGTVKKCVPVFDAITAGYILVLPADVHVKQVDGKQYFEWANLDLIDFHPVEQAPNYLEKPRVDLYPKFINPWGIRTPKGYSCLFTQPFHRESPFKILDGIVDTDNYYAPVNFPFSLVDREFEGLIPAGTPMAQVIPFKRDSWKMELGKQQDIIDQIHITQKLRLRFFDSYKTNFWNRKEFN